MPAILELVKDGSGSGSYRTCKEPDPVEKTPSQSVTHQAQDQEARLEDEPSPWDDQPQENGAGARFGVEAEHHS